MPRPPTQQHRVLAALERGLIVRVDVFPGAAPSWQWWTGTRWRKTTGAEYNALTAVTSAVPPWVEPNARIHGGVQTSFRLTEAGRLKREEFTRRMGPPDVEDIDPPQWT